MKYVLVIVVLGVAASVYAAFGRAEVAHDVPQQVAVDENKVASVNDLLTGLESRLADNPDDGKGWLLLAKSYEHLGRTDEAIDAYRKASALGVTDEQLLYRLMSKSTGWGTQR